MKKENQTCRHTWRVKAGENQTSVYCIHCEESKKVFKINHKQIN